MGVKSRTAMRHPDHLIERDVLGMLNPMQNSGGTHVELTCNLSEGLSRPYRYNHLFALFDRGVFLPMSASPTVIMEQKRSASSDTWVFSIL